MVISSTAASCGNGNVYTASIAFGAVFSKVCVTVTRAKNPLIAPRTSVCLSGQSPFCDPSLPMISSEPADWPGDAAKTASGWNVLTESAMNNNAHARIVRSDADRYDQGPLRQRSISASPTVELEPEHNRKRCLLLRNFSLLIASPFRSHFGERTRHSCGINSSLVATNHVRADVS